MSGVEKPADSVSNEQNQNIRHDLVSTAVNFLLNPTVINKPYASKTAFLKKKGLTDAEISLAFKQAESDPKHDEILRNSNAASNLPVVPPPLPVYRKDISLWSRLSRFSSSLIVLGVALFGAHYIYKTYIEPLIFGIDSEKKKSQRLEKQLIEVASSLSQMQRHVASLEENMKSQKGQIDKFFQIEGSEYYPTPLALRELKTEVAAVKSLLLNRHQFPALPKVTPTIPQWQLPPKESENDTPKQNGATNEHQFSDDPKSSASKSASEVSSEGEDEKEDTIKQVNGDKTVETPEIKSLQESSVELTSESVVS